MMDIKIKIDYVYINCDVMINLFSEIENKNLNVDMGWMFDSFLTP